MKEASLDEKIALVGFYQETGSNIDRAKKMTEDLLKTNPDNQELKQLKSKLAKMRSGSGSNGPGIIIQRGRH
jgi:hypothetical protein